MGESGEGGLPSRGWPLRRPEMEPLSRPPCVIPSFRACGAAVVGGGLRRLQCGPASAPRACARPARLGGGAVGGGAAQLGKSPFRDGSDKKGNLCELRLPSPRGSNPSERKLDGLLLPVGSIPSEKELFAAKSCDPEPRDPSGVRGLLGAPRGCPATRRDPSAWPGASPRPPASCSWRRADGSRPTREEGGEGKEALVCLMSWWCFCQGRKRLEELARHR